MPLETGQVWNEFSECLRGFILKRVSDEHQADEILQDAFVKIHKNLNQLQDKKNLRPWLYQIVRNTIADYFRNREFSEELRQDEAEMAEDAKLGKEASEEIGPCLKALMKRLPDRDRKAIEKVDFEGVSQKELSEKLEISVSGAKSRVQRARGRLKGLLQECCSFELDQHGNVMDYQPKASPLSDCCKEDS